jgi:hypothetical protein
MNLLKSILGILLFCCLFVAVVYGLLWLLTPAPKPELPPPFPPWTVLCDGEGHFTFTWWDGKRETSPNFGMGFKSRDECQKHMDKLREMREARQEEEKRIYKPCSPDAEKSSQTLSLTPDPVNSYGIIFTGDVSQGVTVTIFGDPAKWKTPLDAQFECQHDGKTYRTKWEEVKK